MIKNNLPQLNKRLCVIITNYGDDSLALIQWALETPLLHHQREHQLLKVVSIDTGLAASSKLWKEHVNQAKQFMQAAEGKGIFHTRLNAPIPFQDAVLNRGEFPSPKFQWCSTVLKGLPLLDWLDSFDPSCLAVILSAKRRETLLPPFDTLEEWDEKSEYFNDRALWHPLIDYNETERNHLLDRANFQHLGHPSLECSPCINSTEKVLAHLDDRNIQQIKILEEKLQATLFPELGNIENAVNKAKNKLGKKPIPINTLADTTISDLQMYYRGCGNPYGCGL